MGLLTKKFKLLFDYYINSSLHVSFCIISYIITINLINKICIKWEIISFVFFSTFFTYNFIKFYEKILAINKPISFVLKLFFSKALISLLISFYLFFYLSTSKQIIVLITSLVTILYTIPIMSKYTLRSNPILKIFSVAFCWTMMIVILPFFTIMDSINLFYFSLLIFCLVISQMIPFEIRDKNKDKFNVKTIANNYGTKNSKIIGYFVLIIVLLFTMIICYLLENLVFKNSILIIILTTAILVYFSREKQNKYYSSFIVESVPVYWLIVEIGLQILL